MNNSQLLPPKMQAQFYNRAMNGDYDYALGSGIFIWIVGNYKTTIVSEFSGTLIKLTTREKENELRSIAQYKKA